MLKYKMLMLWLSVHAFDVKLILRPIGISDIMIWNVNWVFLSVKIVSQMSYIYDIP